jgi:cytochrome P450
MSSAALAEPNAVSTTPAERIARLPWPTLDDLKHIPGEEGWPLVGNTFVMLRDPPAFVARMVATHGRVYRNRAFGNRQVALIGADANELVLFDRDKLFSNEQGWSPVLDQLFPRGLMLMDFEEHRIHRRLMSVAFKTGPMQSYIGALNEGIALQLKQWAGQGRFGFYAAIKDLTLRLAAPCFLGLPWGEEADRINSAFVDMVNASIAPIRKPLPFTAMKRGVDGRAFMCEFFAREIPKRRAGQGTDMFTQLCQASDDNNRAFSDQEIIDHMNFLMMAAHDTLTSSVSSLVWLLGKHPEWQEKLADEADALGLGDAPLPYERLADMPLTEMAFKEALRINPPVPALPRRALRSFSFGGYTIPAGTMVGINPLFVHRDPSLWPEPLRFDPLRFTEENSKGRHKYAWVPFGGGAHMCLGLHFAYMQAKVFFAQLLRSYRIDLAQGAGLDWQMWPIPRPKDGLPLRLVAKA